MPANSAPTPPPVRISPNALVIPNADVLDIVAKVLTLTQEGCADE